MDAVKGVERLAVGVQGLALTAREASRFPDRLDLVNLVGVPAALAEPNRSTSFCAFKKGQFSLVLLPESG